ncbi:MAG: hypothetical protein OHK0023_15210 [Anaerolineae bacterium]
MDLQIAKDMILENTNLTADLRDDEAKQVIDWAISQLPNLVANTADDEAAFNKVQGLMDTMRAANDFMARMAHGGAEQAQGSLIAFLQRYSNTFERIDPSSSPQIALLSQHLQALPSRVDTIQALFMAADNLPPAPQTSNTTDDSRTTISLDGDQSSSSALSRQIAEMTNMLNNLNLNALSQSAAQPDRTPSEEIAPRIEQSLGTISQTLGNLVGALSEMGVNTDALTNQIQQLMQAFPTEGNERTDSGDDTDDEDSPKPNKA